jgi:hypothetical protein
MSPPGDAARYTLRVLADRYHASSIGPRAPG